MNDPCNECLIRVCCSQICPKKVNYENLLRHALRENSHFNISQKRIIFKDPLSYSKYRNMYIESELKTMSILSKNRKIKV